MKKILKYSLVLLLIIIITSCNEAGLEKTQTNNPNFNVELLFTKDSINVYRFEDGMHYHYFTKNLTIQNIPCGKNCSYQETIKTE